LSEKFPRLYSQPHPRQKAPVCKAHRWVSLVLTCVGLGSSAAAHAHAFGQRYDLPVPLTLYLLGAAAAVLLSFVVFAAFVRYTPRRLSYPRVNLLRCALGRLLAHAAVIFTLRLVAVAMLILVVLAGFYGDQRALYNLAPTFVWIIWWVGLAYLSALAGDLWALINPWGTTFSWMEALYRRAPKGHELSRNLRYPETLGVWPATVLLLMFAWMELVFPGAAVPANIASMLVAYTLITWTGMFLFGRERWLRQGEAFSLAFGVLARLAPTEIRVARPQVCAACGLDCLDADGQCVNCGRCLRLANTTDRQWNLRPYAVGLLRNEAVSLSMIAFVLLMLSTILFDGFMATAQWAQIAAALYGLLPDLAGTRPMLIKSIGLIYFWLVFLTIYGGVCWLIAAASGWRLSTWESARIFIFTLVPIAIAYHLAHYLTYLLIQGQYIIPLLSDPFGYGWNLLGTAGYRINIAVVGARFAWYTAVLAIVSGHIIAVYLAHVKAAQRLRDRRAAQRSQYPMTALMVIYTVCGLWIVAQPIVETPIAAPVRAEQAAAPATVDVPADAIIPQAGNGELRPLGNGKVAEVKLTYRALLSTFHDGTRMSVADVLYPYVVAYRWGVPSTDAPPHYDSYIDKGTALIRQHLVGLRVVGVDEKSRSIRFGDLNYQRELLIVEVYANAVPADTEQAAAIAPPWSSVPWQVMALMEEAVTRGWAAFSQIEARQRQTPWLDLVRDERLQQRLLSLIEQFERDGYRPQSLRQLVTVDEARLRWHALKAFYQQHHHLLVSNGPYLLKSWSDDATVLQVFRDPGYPLGIGSFDSYPIPRRAFITKIDRRDHGVSIAAEVERVDRAERSFEIVREPLAERRAAVRKKDVILCRYLVIGADGRVLLTGLGHRQEDNTFAIDLKDKLAPGVYSIITALYVNGNTINPDIKQIRYRVPGS
jgi:hypothetical protein